jgi:peptidoglycan/LPS O-acetylase OafA/YrhL
MPQHSQKIDVLRGVAILLVFSYHALLVVFGELEIYDFQPYWLWIDVTRFAPGRVIAGLTPWGMGTQGVTLFLVISGFLIHWGYLKSGAGFHLSEFFNKRFWRIYPPYLVALAGFALTVGSGGMRSLLTHLTLTHNFSDGTFATINPSFWSLALEMQLYLLYPLLLLLRRRLGMAKATLALGLLSLLTTGAGLALQLHSASLWLSALNLWIVWALGAYLGEQLYQGKRVFTGRPYYLGLVYLLLTAAKLTVLYPIFGRLLFSVFFIYLIDWYLHREDSGQSVVTRVLVKTTALVGLYSYSIYLFHQPFLPTLIRFFTFGQPGKVAFALAAAATFGLFFGLAALSYHWLERPSIRWGKRLYARYRRPTFFPARG